MDKKDPDNNVFDELSQFFKVFGDNTRLQIINILTRDEFSVGGIASNLGMEQSAISHQLRILKQSRLVKFRREGKNIFYSLDDLHVKEIFDSGLSHILE